VHPGALVDGRTLARGGSARLRRRAQGLLVSAGEREEANLDRLIATQPGPSRPNVMAVMSPKGGVGKTTLSFLTGSLLASHLRLRVVIVDANPDYGTLAALAPDELRCERTLADLLDDLDHVPTATQLLAYLSRLPTGVHLLGARVDAETLASMTPERYGELVAYLSTFYDLVVLDCGTGIGRPLARFAVERADQIAVVSTPEWVTSSVVLAALDELCHERTTLVVNMSHLRPGKQTQALEDRFRRERLHSPVIVPYDRQLAAMLDSATYTLEALERPTRLAIKRAGLAAAERLV
jgi:MinD-like ATPase involved in chromosome partitioning or flagellar assembly